MLLLLWLLVTLLLLWRITAAVRLWLLVTLLLLWHLTAELLRLLVALLLLLWHITALLPLDLCLDLPGRRCVQIQLLCGLLIFILLSCALVLSIPISLI